MPVSLKLYHCGVSGLKDRFDSKAKKHIDNQTNCAFSDWDKGRPNTISKEDAAYGRPDLNSKSAARAQAAQLSIMTEIRYLCDMVHECAEWRAADDRAAITFGRLFKIYVTISDKLVGTLLRARKHGFVHFDGEMLYQRRDDSKVIELTRNINTIRARFGQRALLAGGGDVQPWGDEVGDEELEAHIPSGKFSRRNSTPGGNLQTKTVKEWTLPPTSEEVQTITANDCSLPPTVEEVQTITASDCSLPPTLEEVQTITASDCPLPPTLKEVQTITANDCSLPPTLEEVQTNTANDWTLPSKMVGVRPRIPKLSNRSQSLDAIGCLMFDPSTTSAEDDTGVAISLEGRTSKNIQEIVSVEASMFDVPMEQKLAQLSIECTATDRQDNFGKPIEAVPRTLFVGRVVDKSKSVYGPMQSMETIEENAAATAE